MYYIYIYSVLACVKFEAFIVFLVQHLANETDIKECTLLFLSTGGSALIEISSLCSLDVPLTHTSSEGTVLSVPFLSRSPPVRSPLPASLSSPSVSHAFIRPPDV